VAGVTDVTQAIRCRDGHEDPRAPAYCVVSIGGVLALDHVFAQAAG
jgi:hypothetical protein